jgi:hypothetical protein
MTKKDEWGISFLPDETNGIGHVIGDEVARGSRRPAMTALIEGDRAPMFRERRE